MVWLAIGVVIICVLLIVYYLNTRLGWRFPTKSGTRVLSFLKSHMPRATTKTLVVTILVLAIVGTTSAIIVAVTRDGNDEGPPPPTLSLNEARSLVADYVYRQFDGVPCASGRNIANKLAAAWLEGDVYGAAATWNDAGYWVLNPGKPAQFTVYADTLLVVPNAEARAILNLFKDKSYEACR